MVMTWFILNDDVGDSIFFSVSTNHALLTSESQKAIALQKQA